MTTDTVNLKKWIEDSQKLMANLDLFPEEVQEVVSRLAAVVNKIAYENIALNEERREWKIKYGNLLDDLYRSGQLKEMGFGSYRQPL